MYEAKLKEDDDGEGCDDDEEKNTPEAIPIGGIQSTPGGGLLKGVTLQHTHELIHFSQRESGHPLFKPVV